MRILKPDRSACRAIAWISVLLMLGVAGCKSNEPKIVPVTGVITRNGRPVANVTIHFRPDKGRPSWGRSDDDGHYTLNYERGRDGAVEGTHKVYVEFRPRSPDEESLIAEGKIKLPQDRKAILDKYGNQAEPAISIEVTPGKTSYDIALD